MNNYNDIIDDLIRIEKENPNDYDLGETIRQYIKEKIEKENNG